MILFCVLGALGYLVGGVMVLVAMSVLSPDLADDLHIGDNDGFPGWWYTTGLLVLIWPLVALFWWGGSLLLGLAWCVRRCAAR